MKNNVEHSLWYRKWNNVFFTFFLILFSTPCIYFELLGVVTLEVRFILGGMFLVILYEWIRSIVLLKKFFNKDKVTENMIGYSTKQALSQTLQEYLELVKSLFQIYAYALKVEHALLLILFQ